MPSLRELQLAFADALDRKAWFEAGAPCADALAPRDRERFTVYANNVETNLTEALRAVYPVVERLVGVEFFAQAAREYVRTVASVSGDLHRYGRSFPEFIGCFRSARSLVYLTDTARLEWLMHETFHAADHDSLDLARLAEVPPERYGELVFCLHPACRLLRSSYPIHRIWQINQPDAREDARVDLGEGGVHLLIARPNTSVEIELLAPAEFAALAAIAAGVDLTSALADAQCQEPGFDAGQLLRRRVLAQTLVDFHLPSTRDF